ncbi:T9SS type A sorting domain-containing protein [Flavivirga eckloniae]|uniref:Secretion system C-terminal sorting domain-containing protein n=1 Tax=Flavivirga eckloniae TaxID=1803846 RepID=A0A2K9PJF5_9FLAO|nr:T9SS type A sorting domain-containing protein [Flavivirga eckloniae]AUP77190.1 hypothetical protein C1H87_00030 [Flavivirga eckloniae]
MKKSTLTLSLLLFLQILNAQWQQIGNNIESSDMPLNFGNNISLSGNGNTLAVLKTIRSLDGGVSRDHGYVEIFNNENQSWTQIGTIGSTNEPNKSFGSSLAINEDGSVVVIGVSFADDNGSASGKAMVYRHINNSWVLVGSPIIGEFEGDRFGSSVAINDDGTIVAIGAEDNNGGDTNKNGVGHVRVFHYENNDWVQIGADINGEKSFESFGESLSMNADGSVIAVGNTFLEYRNNIFLETQKVKIFRNINNNWTQIGNDLSIRVRDGIAYSKKLSISMNNLGDIVAIGTAGADTNGKSNNVGEVKIFRNTNNNWNLIGSPIYGTQENGQFGQSVSINSNGSILAVGSTSINSDSGLGSGQVRIYKNLNEKWVQIGENINGEAPEHRMGVVSISSNGSVVATGNSSSLDEKYVKVFNNQDVLSIDNKTLIDGVSLYPNPASNKLFVTSKQPINHMSLYTIHGALISEANSDNAIDVSQLANGVYLIKINTINSNITKRFIKNR